MSALRAASVSPGEQYGYSKPAYVYLARIIEQLSGDPWDGYVYKNIFTPLGLQRSYFRGTPKALLLAQLFHAPRTAAEMVRLGDIRRPTPERA